MAEPLCSSSSSLLVLMDVLWFQQIILLSSQPISSSSITISTNTTLPHIKTSISTIQSTSPSYLSSSQEDVSPSSDPSPIIFAQDECDDADDEEEEEVLEEETSYKSKRPTRLGLASKTRSHSSSPSVHKLPKDLRIMGSEVGGLRKTRSCKSLMELEYDEVKGFMDLGFTFNEEQLSPRMMSVIPGLQRLRDQNGDQLVVEDEKSSSSSTSGVIRRPYLSEAWLIKRPDSPLLNLKMPRFTASADMKKHLRYWARTVASAIQLDY